MKITYEIDDKEIEQLVKEAAQNLLKARLHNIVRDNDDVYKIMEKEVSKFAKSKECTKLIKDAIAKNRDEFIKLVKDRMLGDY
jgi:hypothetical protein